MILQDFSFFGGGGMGGGGGGANFKSCVTASFWKCQFPQKFH